MNDSLSEENLVDAIEVREFSDIGSAIGVLHEVLFPSRPSLEKVDGPDSVFPHILMILAEGASIENEDGELGLKTEEVRENLARMLADVPAPKSDSKFSRLVFNFVSHKYGSEGKNPGCIEYIQDSSGNKNVTRWMITPKGYEFLWNHVVHELSKGAGFDALGVWFCERLGLRNRQDRLTESELSAPALLALVLADHDVSTKELRERVRVWVSPEGENLQRTASDKTTTGMDRFARTFHNLLTSHKTLLKQTGITNEGKMPLIVRHEDGSFALTPAGKSKLCRKFTTEFVAQKRQILAVEALGKLDGEYAECASVTSFLLKHDGGFGSEKLNEAARELSQELGRRAEEYHSKMVSLFEVLQHGGRKPRKVAP